MTAARRSFLKSGALWAALPMARPTTSLAAAEPGISGLERGLSIIVPGSYGAWVHGLTLQDAMRRLFIPAVSLSVIGPGNTVQSAAYGAGVSVRTLFQAASISKLVASVGAVRLVQQGRLDPDQDVNARLRSWHVPPSSLTRTAPVTLRGLLSMTAGTSVPGYLGYEPGQPLPDLIQILDGAPPANSGPVRVLYHPGSRYAYSGGGSEIAEALMQDVTGAAFATLMADLVLGPAGMADSTFAQPLPRQLEQQAAPGHDNRGAILPGRWRIFPELAAAGLWSTAEDLARLLVIIGRAWRGEANPLLEQRYARAMITRQGGGPYGLGAAAGGVGRSRVLMKGGQNVGYQCYGLIYPATGQGMVVMTGSDNGTILAEALVRRAAKVLDWPSLRPLLG